MRTNLPEPTMHRTQYAILLSLLLSLAPLSPYAIAQEPMAVRAANTSSPRDTLRSFIAAANELYSTVQRAKYVDYGTPEQAALARRALDCLDVSQLPSFARVDRASEAAICIKEVLDRVDLPDWEKIPDLERIEARGGFEKNARWRVPGTRITIARIKEGPRTHEYLFSAGTVDRAVDYFHDLRFHPYRQDGLMTSPGFYRWYLSAPRTAWMEAVVSRLPDWLRNGRSFGMANWKWPGLLIALLLTIAVMVGSYWLYLKLADRVRGTHLWKDWLSLALPILAALAPLGFSYFVQHELGARGLPLYVVSFLSITTALLAATVVVFATGNQIAETIIASPRINTRGLNAQLIRIVSKITSTTAALALVLFGGQYLGIPVSTLLASAGIGGLAFALGAQDTLKDLFGTISLMADKPFRVGERIVIDKYDGVVEDIGLRSTRLRLLTGHLVTLPNDQLARSDVENVGRRPYLRRSAEIHFPLNTPCDKVERAVEILREKLRDHEGMHPDFPPRVFFDEFTPQTFRVRFFCWYSPPDYWDFQAFNDKFNFELLRALERERIPLSLPLRHTYWKDDQQPGGLDVQVTGIS